MISFIDSAKYARVVVPFFLFGGYLVSNIIMSPPSFSAVDFPSWGGDWSRLVCKLQGNVGCDSLSKFPFAYLLVSGFTSFAGDDSSAKAMLLGLNLAFLMVPVVFAFKTLNVQTAKIGVLLYSAATIFSALPPFYVHAGGLEVQSGVILGLFVVTLILSVVYGKKSAWFVPVLFICAVLGPLYKDTNVFVMGVALCGVYAWRARASRVGVVQALVADWRLPATFVLGSSIAVLIAVAYNYFRYKSYLPVPYMVEASEASPDLMLSVVYFFASIFSPNGGVLVAWSLSACVLFLLGRAVGFVFSRGALCVAGGILLLQVGAFSRWWTPFGWEGWGNRLLIPSAVASLIIIILTGARTVEKGGAVLGGGNALVSPRRKGLMVLVVCPAVVASGLYVAQSYSKNRNVFLEQSMWGSDACQAMGIIRAKHDSWAFKTSEVYKECHFERFRYWPGMEVKVSPMTVVAAGQRVEVKAGNSGGVLGRGWSGVEDWGVWSVGEVAEIRFIPSSAVTKLSLELQPFVWGSLKSQRIKFYVDGDELNSVELSERGVVTVFPRTPAVFDGKKVLSLQMYLPQAATPQSLGVNSDQRMIAVGLRALSYD